MLYSSQNKGVDTPIDGSLVILGKPVAQKRHRYTFKKGFARNYDPSFTDKKKFKAKVLEFAPYNILKGSIVLCITFHMPRPKNHYRTGKFSHLLKKDSPNLHIVKPDIDNLVKFVMDAMQGILWNDDCCISALEARKVYSDKPRTEIEYWKINEREMNIKKKKGKK
tara:strand:- start:1328 stop:1825 length:498 start_codon:yes stop_codon:yes gene_type:complete